MWYISDRNSVFWDVDWMQVAALKNPKKCRPSFVSERLENWKIEISYRSYRLINAIKFNVKRSRAPWPYLILDKVYGSREYKISCETRDGCCTSEKHSKNEWKCNVLSDFIVPFANIGCINPDANIVIE